MNNAPGTVKEILQFDPLLILEDESDLRNADPEGNVHNTPDVADPPDQRETGVQFLDIEHSYEMSSWVFGEKEKAPAQIVAHSLKEDPANQALQQPATTEQTQNQGIAWTKVWYEMQIFNGGRIETDLLTDCAKIGYSFNFQVNVLGSNG